MAGSLALDPVLIEKIETLIAKHTAAKVASLESQFTALAQERTTPHGLTLSIFSGDLGKLLAACTLAAGAAAMVSTFFVLGWPLDTGPESGLLLFILKGDRWTGIPVFK